MKNHVISATPETVSNNGISGVVTFQAVGCEFDPRLPLHFLNNLAASAAISVPKLAQNPGGVA
jgi:hypothetical protein